MVAKVRLPKFIFLSLLMLAAGTGYAQDELRKTFFKEADAAKAAAESANAELLAPRNYERGLKEYQDAESALPADATSKSFARTLQMQPSISGQPAKKPRLPRRRSRRS